MVVIIHKIDLTNKTESAGPMYEPDTLSPVLYLTGEIQVEFRTFGLYSYKLRIIHSPIFPGWAADVSLKFPTIRGDVCFFCL